jgi:4-alpha-glucanotransferase
MSEALRRRAEELGVETEYHDVTGTLHRAETTTLERVVEVLEADATAVASVARTTAPVHWAGAGDVAVTARVDAATLEIEGHRLELRVHHGEDHDSIELPHDVPYGCHVLEYATPDGPGESVVVAPPPTMPRSERYHGAGCLFAPVYALWERDDPLPSFRHLHDMARAASAGGIRVLATLPLYATFLDVPYDPSPYSPVSRLHWNELYLDDDTLPPAPLPPQGDEIDWRSLAARRRAQLIEATKQLDTDGSDALVAFASAHPDVGAYARFRSARDAGGDVVVEQSHVLAQYLADRELGAISDDPSAAALALDLPIGSSPVGYEVWADPSAFATRMSVGAPPDSFFADGQEWGFPPPLPASMRSTGYRLWRQLIERAGRHAGIVRIDHAMAVHRLWWVPHGRPATEGVYVRYPREEILTVIAAAAAAAGVTIVAEDLGTVPTEVSDAFDRWDVLGMYEEQFHLDDEPLPTVPARSVAGIRTHDMTPIAAYVETHDTVGYRDRLGRAHGVGIPPRWDAVVEQMLERLAKSDSYLVQADLDDLIGETRPHNLPGRVVPGLWARRFDRPTSEILADPDVRRRLAILGRNTT